MPSPGATEQLWLQPPLFREHWSGVGGREQGTGSGSGSEGGRSFPFLCLLASQAPLGQGSDPCTHCVGGHFLSPGAPLHHGRIFLSDLLFPSLFLSHGEGPSLLPLSEAGGGGFFLYLS